MPERSSGLFRAGVAVGIALALLASVSPAGAEELQEVTIRERLGESIPLDLRFKDSAGRDVTLGEAIQGPTVMALVYYTCPGICTPLLNGMVEVFNRTPLEPGEDFRVITVSFDPDDTPAIAAGKKANYLKQMQRPFPQDAWMFLTGEQESIRRLTESVGFEYKETKDGEYIHPATLVVVSPTGRIARYLTGIQYQPFDLKMALLEASEERSGPTIRKVLLLCFSYDPESRSYVANVTRIGAVGTLALAVVFVSVIVWRGRRERRRSSGEGA